MIAPPFVIEESGILEQGGNAVDAAVAACFALTVTDPGMTSLGGRLHMVFALADGTRGGIDGATQAPSNVPPLAGTNDSRLCYRSAPIPGNPAALDQALKKYGRLKLSYVLRQRCPPKLATEEMRNRHSSGRSAANQRRANGIHSGWTYRACAKALAH